MNRFRESLLTGCRLAARASLVLPLYLASLALGLLQGWPALGARGAGPLLDGVAAGDGDALLQFMLADIAGTAPFILIWIIGALLAALLYALAYNFFSGGVLGVWANLPFWAACRRYVLCFSILGVVLVIMALVALVAAALVGAFAGFTAGAVLAVVLLQLIGLWGELSRAAAVAGGNTNALEAMGAGARTFFKRPVSALILAALGLLLYAAISALYTQVGPRIGWWAPLAQQLVAFGWAWVKVLRLGWASALSGRDREYDTLAGAHAPAL